MPHLAEDQVLPKPHPDPAPLAPGGCEGDWKPCLDAGQEQNETTAHDAEGWRAVDAGAARP